LAVDGCQPRDVPASVDRAQRRSCGGRELRRHAREESLEARPVGHRLEHRELRRDLAHDEGPQRHSPAVAQDGRDVGTA